MKDKKAKNNKKVKTNKKLKTSKKVKTNSLESINENNYKSFEKSRKFILFSQIASSIILCTAMGVYLPFLIPAIPALIGTTSTIIASSVCGGAGLLFGVGLANAKYNYYTYNVSREQIQINNARSNIIQARALEKIAKNIDKEKKPEKSKFSFVEKEKQKRAQQQNIQTK